MLYGSKHKLNIQTCVLKKKHLCQVFQTKESYYFHPFTEESENLNPNPPEEVQKLFIFFPSIYYHHAKVALLLPQSRLHNMERQCTFTSFFILKKY